MQAIDSSALTLLRRVLRISGQGSAQTELLDGLVNQTLDIGPILRRSLAVAGTGGIFIATLVNNHGAGASEEQSSFGPYGPGLVAGNGYPAVPIGTSVAEVPDGFDVWLLDVTGEIIGGTAANFVSGIVSIHNPVNQTGLGVNEAGTVDRNASIRSVARFDAVDVTITGTINPLLEESGATRILVGERLRRGPLSAQTSVSFSSAATGAVVAQANVRFAVLPSGFGQDAVT